MSQINFVYVRFLHCGNKKIPDRVGDDDGKAGKANAKMPGQAGHDSGRGWDDNRTTPLLVLSLPAASA